MNILEARRILTPSLPYPPTPIARAGLRFEKKVFAELQKSVKEIEHNPWFSYKLCDGGHGICCPDILIRDSENPLIIVIEVKHTWVPHALNKLKTLYCPIVEKALQIKTRPLVIAKHLIPGAPRPCNKISQAILCADPIVQWLERGPIQL